jgi:Protein of unknown function (DUF2384)
MSFRVPAAQATAVAPSAQANAAFRAFLRIAELWGLAVEQQLVLLGQPARSTYYKWKKEGAEQLSVDTLERLSYLLGIYKALQILFPDPARADEWLWRPNEAPLLGGQPAMQRMLQGQVADLYVIRQYLDAQLGR